MRAVELDCWMKKDRSRKVSKFEVMEPSLSSFYLTSFDLMGVVFLVSSKPNIVGMSVHNLYERSASAKVGRNVEETTTAEALLEYTIRDLPERGDIIFVKYDEVNLEKYPQRSSPPKGPVRRKYTSHSFFVDIYKTSIEIYRELETNMTDEEWRSDEMMHSDATSYIAIIELKLVPLL